MNQQQRDAIDKVICDLRLVWPEHDSLPALHQLLEQPEQEPVAWMYPDDYERMTTTETFCTVFSVEVASATQGVSTVPLYTTPPAQPAAWVDLTDEEIMAAPENLIARAIEAAHGIATPTQGETK